MARLPKYVLKVEFLIPDDKFRSLERNFAIQDRLLDELPGSPEVGLDFGGFYITICVEPDSDLQALQDQMEQIVKEG